MSVLHETNRLKEGNRKRKQGGKSFHEKEAANPASSGELDSQRSPFENSVKNAQHAHRHEQVRRRP